MLFWQTIRTGGSVSRKRGAAHQRKTTGTALLALAAFGLLLASGFSQADAADLNTLLPTKVREVGVLTAAAIPSYPPFAFVDSKGEPTGIDSELFRAMAEKLEVKPLITPIEFATILPSVQAGRFDVGLGAYFDTPERRQVVLFVNDLYAIDSLVTRPGNPDKISVDDLCGKTISASQGSAEDTNLNNLSKQCTDNGKPAINVVVLNGTPAQIVAVKSGRVSAANVTKAVVAYMASQDAANLAEIPGIVPNASGTKEFQGFIVEKDRMDLAKALEAALNAIIADGSYARILKKWNVPEELWVKQAKLD
jgi:polar amino acid transport system substrate-binding protein